MLQGALVERRPPNGILLLLQLLDWDYRWVNDAIFGLSILLASAAFAQRLFGLSPWPSIAQLEPARILEFFDGFFEHLILFSFLYAWHRCIENGAHVFT